MHLVDVDTIGFLPLGLPLLLVALGCSRDGLAGLGRCMSLGRHSVE